MPYYAIDGVRPVVHPDAYVHPTATLIGDVVVGPGCYIGPSAALRGDFGRLVLEDNVNFQDTCVMHGFPNTDTVIESHGHIGHGAVIHGCRIKRNALVGMNAVVMDGAVVGENSIIAAMAFVKAGVEIPDNSLAAGIPAKVIRALSEKEIAWKGEGTEEYKRLALRSAESMVECTPLTVEEPDRKRTQLSQIKPLYETKKNSE